MTEIFSNLAESVIEGKIQELIRLTYEALKQGYNAEEILNNGLLRGMDVVGQRFKVGEMFIPEVLLSAKAMHEALGSLRPYLANQGAKKSETVVIGTVKGDLHDIGKNLVAMMFQGAGYDVIDLGVNQDPEEFIAAIEKQDAQVLALSALLTTTMPEMKKIIEILKKKGIKGKVKVMVGGAPVTQKFAEDIGADGYAPDAITAVEKIRGLTYLTNP